MDAANRFARKSTPHRLPGCRSSSGDRVPRYLHVRIASFHKPAVQRWGNGTLIEISWGGVGMFSSRCSRVHASKVSCERTAVEYFFNNSTTAEHPSVAK